MKKIFFIALAMSLLACGRSKVEGEVDLDHMVETEQPQSRIR